MTIILIGSAMLFLCGMVFKVYWKEICAWCLNMVIHLLDILKGVITFVLNAGRLVAYLYRRHKDNSIDKSVIPVTVPDPHTLPQPVQEALFRNEEVLVNDDVTRPVNI